jgi:hypothetical protein
MDFVTRPPGAIIANLGYLPGADHNVVTQIPTTVAALTAGLEGLSVGGHLVVVCYFEHPGDVKGSKQWRALVETNNRPFPHLAYQQFLLQRSAISPGSGKERIKFNILQFWE